MVRGRAYMRDNTSNKPSASIETYIEDDNHQKQMNRMNSVLKKYDLDGDGKLDAAEQQHIGHDMLRMEDIARLQKKIIMFAFGIIVFLCVSNIATGYLAVNLAKDMKVAKDGVMKDTSGGNIKTQAIAPKVNLYEPPTDGGRRLQSGNNSGLLQGYLDSEGVAAIKEAGVAHFVTESGTQACDITRVTSVNETLFSLETSCGEGRLELVDNDEDNVGAGRRLQSGSLPKWAKLEIDECRDFLGADLCLGDFYSLYGSDSRPIEDFCNTDCGRILCKSTCNRCNSKLDVLTDEITILITNFREVRVEDCNPDDENYY